MKRNFLFSILILLLFAFIACDGIPSPDFAYIEVLDSDDKSLVECNFSVKYKDEDLSGMECEYREYSDEEFEKECKLSGGGDHISGFKIGKTWYTLSSVEFSDLARKKGVAKIYKNISISVSKEGYVSKVLKNLPADGIYTTTILLEKENEVD